MTSIEERIVSLGFNNQNFEKHAAQSMSTLDKLDAALNAFGGAKGIGLMQDALEAVTSKFSVLGTMGDQVLRRIADGAMDAANKLIQVGKSMSIDQVSQGWKKYGEKTASVQTIMNSTGDSIDKVNGYLSQLMWYSDETSFGFTDMTSALGQMTSSGGKVENLIPLLMGVGNAVAYAGKGASEFSRVIYNLNQSYMHGSLQLMDWKSLELAGVASKQLKQALIDAAIAQGKITEGQVTVTNFTDTLKDNWADKAVMEEAFGTFAEMTMEAKRLIDAGVYRNATEAYQALASKYGEVAVKAAQSAQEAKSFAEAIEATKDAVSSGWLTTFEHIFGNYEEAKVLWTNLTDVLWELFAAGAEMRNEVLEKWHNAKTGGYQTLMDALDNLFEVISKFANLTRGGLLKIILGGKAEDARSFEMILVKATRAFKFFTDDLLKFTNNIERFQVIEKIFTGLHAIFVGLKVPVILLRKAFERTFKPLFTYNGNQMKWPRDLAIILSQLATKFMDLGKSFNEWIRSSSVVQSLSNLAWGIASVFEFIFTGIKSFIDQLKYNFEPEVHKFRIDTILDSLSKFGGLLMMITSSLKDSGALDTFVTILLEAFGLFGDIFDIVSIVANSLLGTLLNKSAVAGNVINNILQLILKVITSIRGVLNGIIESGSLESSISGIGNVLSGLFNVISRVVEFIINHNPFELLAAGAQKAFGFIADVVGKIKEAFSSAFDGENSLGNNLFSIVGTVGLAIIGLKKYLTGRSIKKLIDNFNDILENGFGSKSVLGKIKDVFAETINGINGAVKSFANNNNAKALKSLAISIALLAGSLLVLSLIDTDKLAASFVTLTLGIAEMIGVLVILDKLKVRGSTATNLIKVAGAVFLFALAIGTIAFATLVMAGAIKVLSTIETDKLWSSVAAVAAILIVVTGALVVLSKLASGPKMLAAGVSIMALSVGILVLTAALVVLSLIPYEKLQNGMKALAITLILVGGAIALLSMVGAKALLAAGAMLIISAAILVLTASLAVLAFIPGEALAKGVLAIAAALVVMVAALLVLSLAGPMALVAAGALALLGVGLVLAAAGLAIIAVALRILRPVKRDIPKIAGGLALLGLAMIPLGIGGIAAGLGLIGFLAMIPLAFALSLMRGLNIAKIAGGLAVLGLAFIPLGLGAVALAFGSLGLVAGAIGLSILAAALPGIARGINAMKGIKLTTMLALALGLGALGAAGVFLAFGAAGLYFGAPALVVLAEALPPLADGLNAFAAVAWETIAKAGVILAEAILAMFAINVITLLHDGMPALSEFAEALPPLAEGIGSFNDVDWDGIGKAAVALGEAILAMLGVNIVTLLHDGTPSLKSFAEALPGLASGFKAFTEIEPELLKSVGAATNVAIKALFGAGITSIIDGTPALTNLGNALPILAAGFHAFDGMDPEWLRQIAQSLADGIKALTGDFFSNLFSTSPDFTGISNGIMQLALAMALIPVDSGERLMGIANAMLLIATVSVETLTQVQTNMTTVQLIVDTTMIYIVTAVQINLAQMCADFSTYFAQAETIVRQAMSNIVSSVSSTAATMYNLGASIGQNLVNGLLSKLQEVQAAASQLRQAASGFSSSSYTIGFEVDRYGAALFKGAGNNYGYYLGTGVATGARSALGIHSPSKVMEEIGKYVMLGFGKGVDEESGGIGDGFITALNPILAAISALLDSDMDLSPSITPVVDLSNVTDAAGTIQDYLANGSELTGRLAYGAGVQANRAIQNRSTESVESQFTNDSGAFGSGVTINVYPSQGMDEKALADKVIFRLSEVEQRRRASLG